VLIARLAGELRCYEPEGADAVWARLRHLGACRRQFDHGRDGCGEPDPGSARVRLARGAGRVTQPVPVGDLVRVAGGGAGPGAPGIWAGSGGWAWTGSPRRCGGSCPGGAGSGRALGIIRAVFAALADPAGGAAHRPGALERAHLALGDWRDTRARLAGTETRMAAVLDDLGLTEPVTTTGGLTVTGAAAILAETGDPAGPACGWPPGGRSGRRCRTTRSWPPGSLT